MKKKRNAQDKQSIKKDQDFPEIMEQDLGLTEQMKVKGKKK